MLPKRGGPSLQLYGVFGWCFYLVAFLLMYQTCNAAQKIRYASMEDCDRHSLDAVYHEKYKPITNNVFADIKEFGSRVLDLVSDSLTTVMSELPDRDVSGDAEKNLYAKFKTIKSRFAGRIKKMQKNITSSWERLIVSHFDLMYDNGKSSLEDYQEKIVNVTDSYTEARKSLDSTLSSLIEFAKATISDGMRGIELASKEAIKEEKKKNATEDNKEERKNEDDLLQEKKLEIAKMVIPGFLGKVTLGAIERKMDPNKNSGILPENRHSVLDDLLFDMALMKNRMLAIMYSDVRRDIGATNLARRSIYTYWADVADGMYKDKIQGVKSTNTSATGRMYYRNLWKDEEQLVETLLNFMEIYP